MFQFLGRPKTSGAVVTAVFYVVVLRQRGDNGCTALYLADAVQDDFGTADVPDILQVVGEDYDREGTGHSIFTEVQEVNALVPDVDADDLPSYALRFANVLAGFVYRDAVGRGRGAGNE